MDKQNSNSNKRGLEHLLNDVTPHLSMQEREELQQQLQEAIAYLIVNDFNRLVQLLYRVDVDEKHLKSLLQQQQDGDAAALIATLLIERQLQKAILRQQFRNRTDDENEERW